MRKTFRWYTLFAFVVALSACADNMNLINKSSQPAQVFPLAKPLQSTVFLPFTSEALIRIYKPIQFAPYQELRVNFPLGGLLQGDQFGNLYAASAHAGSPIRMFPPPYSEATTVFDLPQNTGVNKLYVGAGILVAGTTTLAAPQLTYNVRVYDVNQSVPRATLSLPQNVVALALSHPRTLFAVYCCDRSGNSTIAESVAPYKRILRSSTVRGIVSSAHADAHGNLFLVSGWAGKKNRGALWELTPPYDGRPKSVFQFGTVPLAQVDDGDQLFSVTRGATSALRLEIRPWPYRLAPKVVTLTASDLIGCGGIAVDRHGDAFVLLIRGLRPGKAPHEHYEIREYGPPYNVIYWDTGLTRNPGISTIGDLIAITAKTQNAGL